MRWSELQSLIRMQFPADPDPVVMLDIDIGKHPLSGQEVRAPRRIVDARLSTDGTRIILESDSVLLPDEQELIDNGLYSRMYDQYEQEWNSLPITAKRFVLGLAEVGEAGLSIARWEDETWSALPKRIQQMIIVRVNLPIPKNATFQDALIQKGVKNGTVLPMRPRS